MINRLAWLCAATAGFASSGCVTTRPLSEMAVDSNRLVAESANEQTMLNILRASDRMPMHFTSFSAVRGNLTIGGTVGLGASLPTAGATRATDAAGGVATTRVKAVDTVSPSLQANIAANPSFDLAIYDTKEFQSGILGPISPSLIEYYLRQGWRPELLTALLISQAQVTVALDDRVAGKTRTVTYVVKNEPHVGTNNDFGKFIDNLVMVPVETPGSSEELLPVKNFKEGLTIGDAEKLTSGKIGIKRLNSAVYEKTDIYVVQNNDTKRSIGFKLPITDFNQGQLFNAINSSIYSKAEMIKISCGNDDNRIEIGDERQLRDDEGKKDKGEKPKGCDIFSAPDGRLLGRMNIKFFLRSPESLLYFLGAYARCELGEDPRCYEEGKLYKIDHGRTKVIEVIRGTSARDLVTVRYTGRTFSLPAPRYLPSPASADGGDASAYPTHRGSQALTLVQQLINMHKSADSLPVSSSIQLIP